jgi:hypothetical protein
LFSAIDGLGKLTHTKSNAGAGMRFKYFISTLGKKYEKNKDLAVIDASLAGENILLAI